MRGLTLLAILAFVGTGFYAQAAMGSDEGKDGRLLDLLRARWEVRAEMEVVSVTLNHSKMGGSGYVVKADEGYVFHEVRVLLRNNGSVPFSASTWHFSAIDEFGRSHPVEISMARHDFDAAAVREGFAREGRVIFELPEGMRIAQVAWHGELAWALADVEPSLYG